MREANNEIKELILDFFEEYPDGKVTLLYPRETEIIRDNIRGMDINKHAFDGDKIRFYKHGIYIRNILGFSLVTGKHLFLPYGCFSIVFEEGE